MDDEPFLVSGADEGLEVFEGAGLELSFVDESVLFVDEGEFPSGADGFGLFELGGVDFALVGGAEFLGADCVFAAMISGCRYFLRYFAGN